MSVAASSEKYIFDNDLHIHSKISLCSNDDEQTKERILSYAMENCLNTICVTDHFWDESVEGASSWYAEQNYKRICAIKPLPKKDNIRFLFGCETEMNRFMTVGISKQSFDWFDFVIIPTTHFHMIGYTLFEEETISAKKRADAWIRRMECLLNADIPFHKIGIAHLTCPLIAGTRREYLKTLELIPTSKMEKIFKRASDVGVGIELNADDMNFSDEEADIVLRPYQIAKEYACKFYCGSDAHHPKQLKSAKMVFERALSLLELDETDKFHI